MKLGKVDKQTLLYSTLKFYGKIIHDFFFYKSVKYIGIENIPKDKPVLIAPNHQNALMDALAIIFAQKIQPVFLARSDIFKNPIVAKVLFAFKILPVFRLRDGKEKLKLNEIIYNKTIEVLELNRQVAIFPEAQHIDKKHIRKLKKGIQRIAFQFEYKNDFKADVQIVPVGIYYSNYWNFRSKLMVKFGKPLSIAKYKEEYKEDPARAIVKFTSTLHKKIEEQVIHIKYLEYHDEYELIRKINMSSIIEKLGLNENLENEIKASKITINKLDSIKTERPKVFDSVISKTKQYSEILRKYKLKDWVIQNKKSNILLRFLFLLIISPVFIYGLINNIVVYLLPGILTKKLEDRQFQSSIVFVFGMFFFPIIYFLQAIIVWIIFKLWFVSLIYFISVPFFGLFAFEIHRFFVKTMSLLRFNRLKNKEEGKKAVYLRNEILIMLK